MAQFLISSSSRDGFHMKAEFKAFPVNFVNALRRIMLHGVPTVVIRDVQILENKTQMPHEMLKHRMELVPVNVNPDEAKIIRDALVELKVAPDGTKDRFITTDDFTIESGRDGVLLKDKDLKTPMLFIKVRKNESLHIRGRLTIDADTASQVCTATHSFHVDEELAKQKRQEFIEKKEDDVRVFDNFYIQRYYSRDPETGDPNWIDLDIESVGVLSCKEILRMANDILRQRVAKWFEEALEKIGREPEPNSYRITMQSGGYTVGNLVQKVMYDSGMCSFQSCDMPHPLRQEVVVRFYTEEAPEKVLTRVRSDIHEYCGIVEKGL